MKKHLFRRMLSLLLAAAMLAGCYVPSARAVSTGLTWKETDRKIAMEIKDRRVQTQAEETHESTEIVRVSIVLEDKPTVQAGFATRFLARNSQAMAYSRRLLKKQEAMANTISARVLGGRALDVQWNLTLVGNVISANVPYGKLDEIRAVKGVRDVFLEIQYEPCVVNSQETVLNPQMYSSLGMAGSSWVWTNGYTGAGSRIAVIDTGTDTDHQSLDNGAYLYALEQNAAEAGLSYAQYVGKLDLLDAQEVASVLPDLKISQKINGLTAEKLFLSEKLPFAVNYVDANLVVNHDSDYRGSHGSHVAGIATANRYIPRDGGYVQALDSVLVAGMAPDAQLITMKVFGQSSPYEADYMAAVEDAILLGCDCVNLSLGAPMADSSFSRYYSGLLNYMTTTDTVVVASAGNSYSWPKAGYFGYLYSEDVNFDTVGSPGSYSSFFTVASVDNDGDVGDAFRAGGRTLFYGEKTGYGNTALADLDKTQNKTGTEYDYLFIDGLGYPEDYTGMDLYGKVVFCSRGTLNFAAKANNAMDKGAIAVVIYNNEDAGPSGMDLTGLTYAKPCVSITRKDADALRAASESHTAAGGITYYTGRMTIMGKQVGVNLDSQYYRMSDFSSWGVPGNLSLKPEITAPGGNIYSINGMDTAGTAYELMSGTSMAAPAISGMAALVAQYIREKNLDTGVRARTLIQSLLMSTATPLREEDSGGQYYSLLKQGAGLARADLAVAADSYILVDGQNDGKVKAELGDDPQRTGIYEFTFSIHNLSGEAENYLLSADVFCQNQFEYSTGSEIYLLDTWTTDLPAVTTFTVNGREIQSGEDLSRYDWNGDGIANAGDADYLLEYLLGNEETLHGTGDISGDGRVNTYDAHVLLSRLANGGGYVSVPAGGSVTVDVKLTLTAQGKAMLEAGYPNGTYVEAFVYAESIASQEGEAGTVHSIPVLAFYGNWSDPSMFDHGFAAENVSLENVELVPYLYRINDLNGNRLSIDYGSGTECVFGGNPYVEDTHYLPQRNAFNSTDGAKLAAQYYVMIRNASDSYVTIRNSVTGEEYYRKNLGEQYAAYYHVSMNQWMDTQQKVQLNWNGTDAAGKALPEGTGVEVSLVAMPEYYRNADGTHDTGNLGKGAYLTTGFTIDNTAPEVVDMENNGRKLIVTARDNTYVAAVALFNTAGDDLLAIQSPNQTVANAQVAVELDLTQIMGEKFLLMVCDYAGNERTYEIEPELPEMERGYVTVADYESAGYYDLYADGSRRQIASGDRGSISAVEFVDGWVYEISNGDSLYVAYIGKRIFSLYLEDASNISKMFHPYYLEKNMDIFIGREPACDIQYRNRFVSREHAILKYVGDKLIITDRNSANGVYVNGKRIQTAELHLSDIVHILGLCIIVGAGFIAVNKADKCGIMSQRVIPLQKKNNIYTFYRGAQL